MRDSASRRDLSDATVVRLPVYLRALTALATDGRSHVSSDELAEHAGVSPAKLRKDLSQIGSLGVRGVGYDIAALGLELSRVLGLARTRPVVIVGMGHLGRALAHYSGFATKGFEVTALVDRDPAVVGEVHAGLAVRHPDELAQVVAGQPDVIGVIATPASSAQDAADVLVAAGVRSLLDFAPTRLHVPDAVEVRYVDLSTELQLLGFRTAIPDPAAAAPAGAPA